MKLNAYFSGEIEYDSEYEPEESDNESGSDSESGIDRESKQDCSEPTKMAERNTEQLSFGLRPKKEGCKQVYDKVHYCKFCSKKVTKVCRHLLSVHKSETRVLDLVTL